MYAVKTTNQSWQGRNVVMFSRSGSTRGITANTGRIPAATTGKSHTASSFGIDPFGSPAAFQFVTSWAGSDGAARRLTTPESKTNAAASLN